MQQVKILLDESDIPENWYNVVADMPSAPAPPLGPDGNPIGPEALSAIFPDAIIGQEVSRDALAKKLARYTITGRKRSLRDVAAELEAQGHVTADGKRYAPTAVSRMIAA